jgi:hypothetical protein
MKDRFYEELQHVSDKFPKYHLKILLGDFNAKVGRGDIFKPPIGNESLHEISNDNGVRVVNFASSKNHIVKITMLPHGNIYKFTWTSEGNTQDQIDHILIADGIQVYLMSGCSGQQIVILTTSWWWKKLGRGWQ